MWDLKLDEQFTDLYFNGNGNYDLVTGIEEAKQSIIISLRTFLNDYAFNVDLGIDWQNIFRGEYTQSEVISQIESYLSTISSISDIITTIKKNPEKNTSFLIIECKYSGGGEIYVEIY